MANPSDIELIVMRRVRLIRMLTLVISTVTLVVITVVAALWGIGREVWVAHVFENMPSATHGGAFFAFWLTAFTHTRLIVQALTILTGVSLIFLVREITRFIASFFVRPEYL